MPKRMSAGLYGLALTLAGLALGACATSRPAERAAGEFGHVIDCSGANLSWSHCYRKAGETCTRGYAVIAKPYKRNQRIVAGDFYQLVGAGSNHRRMLIECRNEPGETVTPAPVPAQSPPAPAASGSRP